MVQSSHRFVAGFSLECLTVSNADARTRGLAPHRNQSTLYRTRRSKLSWNCELVSIYSTIRYPQYPCCWPEQLRLTLQCLLV